MTTQYWVPRPGVPIYGEYRASHLYSKVIKGSYFQKPVWQECPASERIALRHQNPTQGTRESHPRLGVVFLSMVNKPYVRFCDIDEPFYAFYGFLWKTGDTTIASEVPCSADYLLDITPIEANTIGVIGLPNWQAATSVFGVTPDGCPKSAEERYCNIKILPRSFLDLQKVRETTPKIKAFCYDAKTGKIKYGLYNANEIFSKNLIVMLETRQQDVIYRCLATFRNPDLYDAKRIWRAETALKTFSFLKDTQPKNQCNASEFFREDVHIAYPSQHHAIHLAEDKQAILTYEAQVEKARSVLAKKKRFLTRSQIEHLTTLNIASAIDLSLMNYVHTKPKLAEDFHKSFSDINIKTLLNKNQISPARIYAQNKRGLVPAEQKKMFDAIKNSESSSDSDDIALIIQDFNNLGVEVVTSLDSEDKICVRLNCRKPIILNAYPDPAYFPAKYAVLQRVLPPVTFYFNGHLSVKPFTSNTFFVPVPYHRDPSLVIDITGYLPHASPTSAANYFNGMGSATIGCCLGNYAGHFMMAQEDANIKAILMFLMKFITHYEPKDAWGMHADPYPHPSKLK